MGKKVLLMLLLATLCFCQIFAASTEQQFAFFKRTVSPVMKWGENGILTVPKATTVGRTNSYFGLFGQQAGTINNLDLYSTSFSVIVGTSEDVELGYTRRQLIWEDFYLTDMSMDTFHIKARVLDFNSPLLPEVSIGMNGVSLVDNSFRETKDILFNPFIVATSNLKLFPGIMEFSVTVMAETIMSEGEFGTPQFSIGADFSLFDLLYVFGEVQGVQLDLENFDLSKTANEMINVGAKLKIGWFSLGVGLFNIVRTTDSDENGSLEDNISSSSFDIENARYMASVVFEIPLGQVTGSKEN